MLNIFREDGSPIRTSLVGRLQLSPHAIECVIEVRTERDDEDEWSPLTVTEASVTLNQPGEPATLEFVTVPPLALKGVDNNQNLIPVVDYGGPHQAKREVTPWGSVVRVHQRITTPGYAEGEGAVIVPWGFFIVTDVNTELNTQKVTAVDPLIMLDYRGYVPLAKQRVRKKNTKLNREATNLRRMVNDRLGEAWPPGTDPWAKVVDWYAGPTITGGECEGNKQYDLSRRDLIRKLLKRDEFEPRTKAQVEKAKKEGRDYDLGLVIEADRRDWRTDKTKADPVAIYRIKREFDPFDPPKRTTRDIKAEQGLVSMVEKKTRDGVINRAVVMWDDNEGEDNPTQKVVRSYRTVVDLIKTPDGSEKYDQEVSKIHIGQRFGTVTSTVDSPANKRAGAEKRGRRLIMAGLLEAVTWDITCSPMYGLEINDVVSLCDPYGNTGWGFVTGMRVNLTHRSDWQLEISPLNVIDTKVFGTPKTRLIDVDVESWRTIYSDEIAEGMKRDTGWSCSGGTINATKLGMLVVSSRDGFTLQTVRAHPSNSRGIAQASVQVGTTREKLQVRVGIRDDNGTHWGPWETILKRQSETVSSEPQPLRSNPTGKLKGKFGVVIEVKDLGANGGKVDFNGITVEVPGIARDDRDDITPPGKNPDITEIRQRANSWLGLAYGYSRRHTNRYGTYRLDCSGFVSMALNWPEGGNGGYDTTAMDAVTKSIKKSELQPGDIMLDNDPGAGGHVVLFDGWANSERTRYWGYEMASSLGCVRRQIAYPYSAGYGPFYPRRPN